MRQYDSVSTAHRYIYKAAIMFSMVEFDEQITVRKRMYGPTIDETFRRVASR